MSLDFGPFFMQNRILPCGTFIDHRCFTASLWTLFVAVSHDTHEVLPWHWPVVTKVPLLLWKLYTRLNPTATLTQNGNLWPRGSCERFRKFRACFLHYSEDTRILDLPRCSVRFSTRAATTGLTVVPISPRLARYQIRRCLCKHCAC